MSLLLDALRRAESDARKNKSAAADEVPAFDLPLTPEEPAQLDAAAAPQEYPEFTLDEYTPAPESPAELPELSYEEPVQSQPQPPVFGAVLDFELPHDDTPEAPKLAFATSRNREVLHPFDKDVQLEPQVSNWGVLTSQPASPRFDPEQASDKAFAPGRNSSFADSAAARLAFARPAPAAETSAPKRVAAPAPASRPTPVPTPMPRTARQSLSAAGIMAGSKLRMSLSKERRRQLIVFGVALVVALPLVAFLLFGNALFESSSTMVATQPSGPPPSAPAGSPPAAVPEGSVAAVPGPAPVAAPSSVVPPSEPPLAPAPAAPVATSSVAQATPRPVEAPGEPYFRRSDATPDRDFTPRSSRQPRAGTAAAGGVGPSLVSSPAKPVPMLDSAYAAYQGGNPGEAVRLYREVLRADPAQRDAWLGLAVIAHANNQREPAMDAYRRVLRLEPQNATALAGVSSLSNGAGEAQQESRLRELLARSPQEADLNHALALVLSGEQRWSEAQPLFFKAHTLAPQEPQFAYNLAVALDHLRKSSLAVQYYETALALGQGKAASFNEANARSRLAALRAGTSGGGAR